MSRTGGARPDAGGGGTSSGITCAWTTSFTTQNTYDNYFVYPFDNNLASVSVTYFNQVLCTGAVASINNQVTLTHAGTIVSTAPSANAFGAPTGTTSSGTYNCSGTACAGVYSATGTFSLLAFPGQTWKGAPGCTAVGSQLRCTNSSGNATVDSVSPLGRVMERFQRGTSDTSISAYSLATMAQQCFDLTAAANLNSSHECLTEPIFVPGINVQDAMRNDYDGLAVGDNTGDKKRHPEWVKLTYGPSNSTPPVHTGWYDNVSILGPGRCAKPRPAGKQCDEFPYASTTDIGGGHGLPVGTAAVSQIDDFVNRAEGTALQMFYNRSGVNTGTGSKTFLVLPTRKDAGNGTVSDLPISTFNVVGS